jgi:hypothetical protein
MKKLVLTAFICSSVSATASAQLSTFVVPPCPVGGNALGCGFRQTGTVDFKKCPNNRWVGFWINDDVPMPNCPADSLSLSGNWRVKRLFSGPTAGPDAMPPLLARFCTYEWTSRFGAPPDVSVLPNAANFRLERDCRIASPLLEPNAAAAGILEAAYDRQFSQPAFLNWAVAPPIETRVAIIDTTPDETTSGLPSGAIGTHGRAMGELVHHNSCMRRANGTTIGCTAHIANYQGMGLSSDGNEGSHGYPSTVASAIRRAVADWKVSPQDNLIINLSLGWEDPIRSAYGSFMSVTAASAYVAIQYATCEGALVFASTGNQSRMGGAPGPMYPAAYEIGERLCAGFGTGYEPVIQAVGAVDGIDRKLDVQRENGTPRMVAPSMWVSVNGSSILTGTSLSAAGVSGLAAMIWSLQPWWPMNLVTDQIQMSSVSLGATPDFDLPPIPWTISRVRACHAIDGISTLNLPCVSPPAFTDQTPDHAAVVEAMYPGLIASEVNATTSLDYPTTVINTPEATSSPFTLAQPDKPQCPTCLIDLDKFAGQFVIPSADVVTEVHLKIDPCDPTFCDPVFKSIKIELADYSAPFSVTIPGLADIGGADSAVVEIHGTGANGSFIRMSQVGIE